MILNYISSRLKYSRWSSSIIIPSFFFLSTGISIYYFSINEKMQVNSLLIYLLQ